MSFRDRIREGAAEVLGFDALEETVETLTARMSEANQDARMISRAVEDADWTGMGGTGLEPYREPTVATRREDTRQAYLYYFNDPIVGRTVDLRTNYAFSKGVRKPKYRDDVTGSTSEIGPGQKAVDAFWNDAFNQKVLFGAMAQKEKGTEIQLQANIFLLLLPPDEQALRGTEGGAPNVPTRIADLPQQEIVDVIAHPGNRKIPLFYKRQYTPRVYNFDDAVGTYEPGTPKVVYYRDWRFEAPKEWEGKPWGPDPKQIAPGLVYHIATNRTSSMKFGVPEVKRYLKWARGLNDYMHSRMNLVQALSQIAMTAKVRGGPRHVNQIAGTLGQLAKHAESLEGSTDLSRAPADRGKTKIPVTNDGVELTPNVTDTNSSNALNDVNTLKSQVAAGSGIPVHHLGGSGDANLAQSTSMDAPLQRLCESDQELWEGVYRDLNGWELTRLGHDPQRLQVAMPPILSRDVAVISAVVVGLIGAVDPNVSNRKLVRWCVGEVLDAMGIDNVNELLDQFFPEDWQSPLEQQKELMSMGAEAAPGEEETPGETSDGGQATKTGLRDGARAVGRGRRMAGVEKGPAAAIKASQDRAQARQERALTSPVESMVEGLVEAGYAEDEAREQVEAVLNGIELPEELREVGAAALAELTAGDASLPA